MAYLYHSSDCECCTDNKAVFKFDEKKKKKLLASAKKAYQYVQGKGGYNPSELAEVPEYKNLIAASNSILQDAIILEERIPEEMLNSLREDVFVFSGMRTHAQLLEASRLLVTDEGKVKPFSRFYKDVRTIDANYNEHYLEAEYLFATGSAQMAANWAGFSDNTGRYALQYRTADDNRVRDAHAKLHNITLPKDDEFWIYYSPKNGWRCRCRAVEVRIGKYTLSDSKKASELGDTATTQLDKDGNNKLAIFRFNPGVKKVVFPPEHPYNKLAGAKEAKKAVKQKTIDEMDTLPENFKEFATKNKLDLDKDAYMFSKLKKPVRFEEWGQGSFYRGSDHKVVIAKGQKGLRKTVIHEFGHAIDAENKFYENPKTLALMGKYISKYGRGGLDELDRKVKLTGNSHDVTCIRDTIMSLSINSGAGHTKAYFKADGGRNRPKEFLAHCFENRFDGNDVFKEHAPEMYEDMKNLIDELLNEIE